MRFSTLQDWLEWQESCHPKAIELGLERVGQVARAMQLSLRDCQVVTVAGTNGKGSCVAALKALLLAAGKRVGCFTSPHFLAYNERVQINNLPVTDHMLVESFDRIDRARQNISLSYFEFGTLAALDIFQRSQLDVAILEVGLGGRLDAVNIIDADVAVVTSVDLDHEDWLGSDREQIGREKAGIFRAGQQVVSAGYNPPRSLQQQADALGAKLHQAGVDFDSGATALADGSWWWRGQTHAGAPLELPCLPALQLPRESVAAAIQVMQWLEPGPAAVDYACLATASLPGRFQHIELEGKALILDVAHNPAAASYLARQLQQQSGGGRRFALVAMMADKDVAGIIQPLAASFDQWFAVQLEGVSRAMSAELLADNIRAQGVASVRCSPNVAAALATILPQMTSADRLVVFGSFYTVAEVLAVHGANDQREIVE